jgi:hypothetical protein
MRPTKIASTLCALATLAAPGIASASDPAAAAPDAQKNGVSFGFAISRFQDDFGASLLASTPFFAGDSLRLTLGGGIAWYPYAPSSTPPGDQVWTMYEHGRLVIEGGHRLGELPLRLYGFGGFTTLFASELSTTTVHPGGVGGFGFELYMPAQGRDGPVSYFIELGGIGSGAQGDKIPGKPIFANGFLIQVGLRVYP